MNWLVLGMMHYTHPVRSLAEGLIAAGETVVGHVPTKMVGNFIRQDVGLPATANSSSELVARFVDRTVARIHDLDAILFCHSKDLPAKSIRAYRERGLCPIFYFFDPYPSGLSDLAKEALPEFEVVFVHGEAICAELSAMGARRTEVLYPGLAGASAFPAVPPREKDVDIVCSFTAPYEGRGWRCTDRTELVKAFRSKFGDRFVHHGKQERWAQAGIECQPLIQPHEMHALYSRAKIVLNAHARHGAKHYCNHRFFEIPACGGFQLCDACNDLQDLQDTSIMTYYTTPHDAVALAHEYLGTDDRRQSMANAAWAKCDSAYKYSHLGAGATLNTVIKNIKHARIP